MKIHDIQNNCKQILKSLVNRGELVCDKIEANVDKTYFCDKCNYTQYIHLCKEICNAEL